MRKNNKNITISGDLNETITGNVIETIDGTKNLTVSGITNETYNNNKTITINGTLTETITNSNNITISGTHSLTVNNNNTEGEQQQLSKQLSVSSLISKANARNSQRSVRIQQWFENTGAHIVEGKYNALLGNGFSKDNDDLLNYD